MQELNACTGIMTEETELGEFGLLSLLQDLQVHRHLDSSGSFSREMPEHTQGSEGRGEPESPAVLDLHPKRKLTTYRQTFNKESEERDKKTGDCNRNHVSGRRVL